MPSWGWALLDPPQYFLKDGQDACCLDFPLVSASAAIALRQPVLQIWSLGAGEVAGE